MNDEKAKNDYIFNIAKYDAERGIMIEDYHEFKDDAYEDGYYVGRADYEKYVKYFNSIQNELFQLDVLGRIE